MYYEKYGNGNINILILPGWGNNRNTFYNMIDELKDNYTVYIIDYPGFGLSSSPDIELNIYDYTFIINSFIKYLNLENLIIIAHSFGGRISSILLSDYNINITKLILIDVAGIKRFKPFLFLKTLSYKLLKKITCIFPKNIKYKLRKKLFRLFSSSDYNMLPNKMKKTFKNIIKVNLVKYYKNISCKTLIIWGENDIDTPISDAYKLSKIIKNSYIKIYKNCGHFSYIERSKQINNYIINFIKRNRWFYSSIFFATKYPW